MSLNDCESYSSKSHGIQLRAGLAQVIEKWKIEPLLKYVQIILCMLRSRQKNDLLLITEDKEPKTRKWSISDPRSITGIRMLYMHISVKLY